jgi:hypothetical protein
VLYTDADTYFYSEDAILLSVLYMQEEKLDILTGISFIELRDFW